ncbi:hypothetical protein QBC33DRAFT_592071 [Phialemonium atrogriseum]|uniref:RRM domain-containing protein n=1 Tax=Phialemonium atrogriseum TaxID=1093897 RepID=A0AAJ0CC89_9PEZI|nr:uncharacterized protein QBC33DRAFT_592071 [Phialemonium atrogriseum]KAK1771621.1 hypothetical protein QBC33DRAFT_592071 [Phialemonium atrogriseum]
MASKPPQQFVPRTIYGSGQPRPAASASFRHPSFDTASTGESPRVFRPMESKLSQRNPASQQHRGPFPPQHEAWARMIAGFSPNYCGNISLSRNRSADIPEHQNCSLFILNLPADITTRELLANIRNAGRVYATHINAPEPDKGHGTCAAKVIFFERPAAEHLFDQCRGAGGFAMAGRAERGRVIWNRIRTAEQGGPRHQTRVLQIAGPAGVVNEPFLTAYFQSKLDFQVDEVLDVGGAAERRVVEYRFGSFRCQAEAARMALAREWSEHDVKVWFGPDPCDIDLPPVGQFSLPPPGSSEGSATRTERLAQIEEE